MDCGSGEKAWGCKTTTSGMQMESRCGMWKVPALASKAHLGELILFPALGPTPTVQLPAESTQVWALSLSVCISVLHSYRICLFACLYSVSLSFSPSPSLCLPVSLCFSHSVSVFTSPLVLLSLALRWSLTPYLSSVSGSHSLPLLGCLPRPVPLPSMLG